MNNHNEKIVCKENLDEAFDRLTSFQTKDIESISMQIDEFNVGGVSFKGVRINLAALTRILLFVSVIILFLLLLVYF